MRFTKLTGVVACGGESIRMGRDKSLIQYREKPQRYFLYDILDQLCSRTLISCRILQAREMPTGYDYVIDHPSFSDKGPATAVLSVFSKFPDSPLLMIACDYPYLDAVGIKHFIESIKDPGRPQAFYDPVRRNYIPVLAYYPADAAIEIAEHIREPGYSLMQYLISQNTIKYIPRDLRCLISIDTPEDAESVCLY